MRTMTRLLYTEGKGCFQERTDYEIPKIADNEIRVKSVFTGICRSDIAMMNGKFGPLPLEMQGHEGLGKVLEIGKDLVKINGWIILEVGLGDHPNKVKDNIIESGYPDTELIKDYNGDDRVLVVAI